MSSAETPPDRVRLNWRMLVIEVVETAVMAAVIFLVVNLFSARFRIDGASMQNTFRQGEYIVVSRFSYWYADPQRGEIVVFVPPSSVPGSLLDGMLGRAGETDFIKRVIGIPGDKVQMRDGQVFVNGTPLAEPYLPELMLDFGGRNWQVAAGQLFVMGDNRNYSKDSRDPEVGLIPRAQVVGKVWAVYFPIGSWRRIVRHLYPELLPSG